MTKRATLLLGLLIGAALLWFVASIRSALAPFVFAAIIAYVTAPLAEKLENRSVPPTAAAALIVLLIVLLLLLSPLTLLPIMAAQVREFADLLPQLTEKVQALFGDSIAALLAKSDFDVTAVGADGLQQAAGVVAAIFGGGLSALSSLLTLLLITPLALFYFLRDRKTLGGELTEMLPPHIRGHALTLSRDLDSVLGEFLHGQLLVMLTMAAFYSLVLSLAGLPFALTIGVISGVLTFIPYVGFAFGVLLATIAGFGSFQSVLDVVIVWVLMSIGTIVESVLITPRLVGERVGLHPLAVLLALLVMGDLFGFVGVLAALPAAAVLLVFARHLRRRYIGSEFYGRQ